MRHVKIVCTIGPASDPEETLRQMLVAGMDVARLNFSHGSHSEHGARIEKLRKVAAEAGKYIGIILDTQGPEIRIGMLAGGEVTLEEGQEVALVPGETGDRPGVIPINYPYLIEDVRPGVKVLLDDGMISLAVNRVQDDRAICRVENSGVLASRKGVNLPGVEVRLPAVTPKDVDDISFGIAQGVDYIAASFIRRADDVLAIRQLLAEKGAELPILAKIESRTGVENLSEILAVADGVMVARGDLGVEIPPEEVPLVQKEIIRRANGLGKPVITATQMLESMVDHPRPTRAEASDVANAVLDGSDAVMLSGETAKGKYPVVAVQIMSRIAERAEAALPYTNLLGPADHQPLTVPDAISHASCTIARDLGAVAILTPTTSGSTPRMVAKYRPACRIVAASPSAGVLQRLSLIWGVVGVPIEEMHGTDAAIEATIKAALLQGYVQPGELAVITAGVPVGIPGSTNLVKAQVV